MSDPQKYERVCQQAKKLPYPKYKRFLQLEASLDGCISRQLNDTRYIAKATVEYLNLLVPNAHQVVGLKGQLTATLRRLWGLNTILSDLPDSLLWQDQIKITAGEKNRSDHRHHAIDALVVALTDARTLKQLSHGFTVEQDVDPETGTTEFKTVFRGKAVKRPWEGFRQETLKKVEKINVSYRVQRKLTGAFHKASLYGKTDKSQKQAQGNRPWTKEWIEEEDAFVKRKSLNSAEEQIDNTSQLFKIRDKTIREILLKHAEQQGVDINKKSQKFNPKEVWATQPTMPSGVQIKKVRLLERGEGYRQLREECDDHVQFRNNHHYEIFEVLDENGQPLLNKDGSIKRDGYLVPSLEVAKLITTANRAFQEERKKLEQQDLSDEQFTRAIRDLQRAMTQKYPIIKRNRKPNWRFVMSLSINEMFLLEMDDGSRQLHRIQKMTEGSIILRPHCYAGKVSDTDKPPLIQRKKLNTLRGRKVTVSPIGQIRWAND